MTEKRSASEVPIRTETPAQPLVPTEVMALGERDSPPVKMAPRVTSPSLRWPGALALLLVLLVAAIGWKLRANARAPRLAPHPTASAPPLPSGSTAAP